MPPSGVGNTDRWIAYSYLTESAADKDLTYGRSFRGGVRFRTLCRSCNNGIGGKEDKAIIDFFDRVRKLIHSPLLLSPIVRIPAKPNLIYRGLLAHIVSANDSGVPNAFDVEARDIFFKRRSLRYTSLNLFFWIYSGNSLFLMRNAYSTVWHPSVQVTPIQILKVFPLGFMFVRRASFRNLTNLASYICENDDDVVDVPIQIYRREAHPVWPALAERGRLIMLAGDTYGLIGRKD